MPDIEPTFQWLTDGAPDVKEPDEIASGLGKRLIAGGFNIDRIAVFVETLHPTVIGRRFVWEPGKDVKVDEASFDFAESFAFQSTPIQFVNTTGKPVRRRLHRADCPVDYPAIEEFRAEGLTDYLALPLRFTNGQIHVVSWSTRRPGGFTEEDVQAVEKINGPLARLAETYALRRIAGNLLDTYVGSRSGSQILAGHIRRGDTEFIDGAIWLSDLRGFTSMADTLSGEELIETLNTHFDCLVPPVRDHGGEVLKFMGDGMLAIFPTGDGQNPRLAAGAAVQAALEARQNMAALNVERTHDGKEELSFGLALNIGRIHYGNIGAEDRLDFTAIGPAVNLAARMETVAAEIGRDIVVSEVFQTYLEIDTELLGEFSVKGFSKPVSIYAVPGTPSTKASE
ncbi:MAG: adenylate/guanylate cyclase domain-containing protein [Alphaproteobacteria bacterium]